MTRTRLARAGRCAFWALSMTTAIALLGACSPDEPEPSPTAATSPTEAPTPEPTTAAPTPTAQPTPTVERTLTVEEQHVAEAEQTVRDYYAAFNAVAQRGYTDWQANLGRYWGTPTLAAPQEAVLRAQDDSGEYTTGDILVDPFTEAEYIPDPSGAGFVQVRLGYCIDSSSVTIYAEDGVARDITASPRLHWRATLQFQSEGTWTFSDLALDPETPC